MDPILAFIIGASIGTLFGAAVGYYQALVSERERKMRRMNEIMNNHR